MSKNYILFEVDPFCFGPISTTLNVIRSLKLLLPKNKYDIVFIGTGTAYQLASVSGLFDNILECNTIEKNQLTTYTELFAECKLFMGNTNPLPLGILGDKLNKAVFLDTLFWMWDEIRYILDVEVYFIQDFIGIDEKLETFKGKVRRPIVSPPVINHDIKPEKEEKGLV